MKVSKTENRFAKKPGFNIPTCQLKKYENGKKQ